MLAVEHHLGFLEASDWIIELGPGGGDEGGRVVAEGPPAETPEQPEEPDRPLPRGPARRRSGRASRPYNVTEMSVRRV